MKVHVPARKKQDKGLTLIEVLIFTLLMSVVFITLTYMTILSVQTNQIAQDKVRATRYADELKYWLQGEKEFDFNNLVTTLLEGTYCVNSLPSSINDIGAQGACVEYDLNNRFKRELVVNERTDTRVSYSVNVAWRDGKRTFDVQISSVIAPWE